MGTSLKGIQGIKLHKNTIIFMNWDCLKELWWNLKGIWSIGFQKLEISSRQNQCQISINGKAIRYLNSKLNSSPHRVSEWFIQRPLGSLFKKMPTDKRNPISKSIPNACSDSDLSHYRLLQDHRSRKSPSLSVATTAAKVERLNQSIRLIQNHMKS